MLAVAAVSLTIFFACNKTSNSDYGTSGTNPNNIPAEKTVTASLQGRVVDDKGVPVQGAAVSSGSATTVTDVNGVFSFSKISMSSRFGYVQVNKSGFFTGSRSIITNAGASNYVSIQLVPRVSKGSVPASTGGKIVVLTGDTVALPAAGFVNAATGAAYTGNINVYATYLDPTAKGVFKQMPGDLRGIGTDGNETALQSFGMMAVELAGDAGEKLQLAAGKKATLTWKIPDSLRATAPATIALWYFNDSTGRWIEEGQAIRVADSYIGQVGHFTYWNCDLAYSTVNLKVHLKDQNGNPEAYTYVYFNWNGNTQINGGFTDSSGYLQCLINRGLYLKMVVVTECESVLAGANVGPAQSDQDLGTIIVSLDETDLALTGTVVDCNNSPVANGFVNAYLDGLNYRSAVTNGSFNMLVHRCYVSSTQVQLTAGDYSSSQQGSTTQMTVKTGKTDVGQLSTCGVSLNEFVNLTYNNSTLSVVSPPNSTSFSYNTISGEGSSKYIKVYLPSVSDVGTYTASSFYAFDYANNIALGPASGNSLTCTVTGFGPVNQFVTGTLSGNIYDSVANKIYPMTGTFRVKRIN